MKPLGATYNLGLRLVYPQSKQTMCIHEQWGLGDLRFMPNPVSFSYDRRIRIVTLLRRHESASKGIGVAASRHVQCRNLLQLKSVFERGLGVVCHPRRVIKFKPTHVWTKNGIDGCLAPLISCCCCLVAARYKLVESVSYERERRKPVPSASNHA